ncbi:GNAT family N-acetyltransferase [Agrobacterium tumefaciens]|uniref:GNAT superfamily N-acetyltransferase n=1 Tax=Agrobacterium tumefaciens TaxID=358 RepID=A0AAW8LV94_AGRTU|nr:GNAT family N-acetyltransferase [Agrobacterium tumefaciens]MDR6702960.1 GNAT superfamily N-acetyltransferase [Agrobacterium tumefaciens]
MNFLLKPCEENVLAYAQRCMERGQAEGAIPANRRPLSGHEMALIARRSTQDGYLNLGISVFYEPEPGTLWLDILFVEPEFRRQNVGWQLLEETRLFAVSQQFREIALGTLATNAPMRAFMARAPGLFHAERDNDGHVYFSERLARRAAR